MTGANHAALSRSASIEASSLLGLEIAMEIETAARPEHGDARKIEGADVVERAGHQQPRFLAQPELEDWSIDFQ